MGLLVAHDAHGIASLLPRIKVRGRREMTMSQTHAMSQTGSYVRRALRRGHAALDHLLDEVTAELPEEAGMASAPAAEKAAS